MIENQPRIGNFTSSQIYRLLSVGKDKTAFGKPSLEYIQECNYERDLLRSLSSEVNAKPMLWGNLLEGFMFEHKLDTSYQLVSQETITHKEHDFWAGSPDGVKFEESTPKKVIDIKCPFTLKSFCQLSSCNTALELIDAHKDGEKYYWQLVSNAILLDLNEAELIIYAPYEDELEAICKHIQIRGELGENIQKYGFITYSDGLDLPLLKRGGKFKSIHTISFDISDEDKDRLTSAVIKAGELLTKK